MTKLSFKPSDNSANSSDTDILQILTEQRKIIDMLMQRVYMFECEKDQFKLFDRFNRLEESMNARYDHLHFIVKKIEEKL
jgi:hypothetical protein